MKTGNGGFCPEDIRTQSLHLHPVGLTWPVLGAWKVFREQKALGFIMARAQQEGCLLSYHFSPQAQDYLEEIFRAAVDYLFFYQSCDCLQALVPLREQAILAAIEQAGIIRLANEPLRNEDGIVEPYARLQLGRNAWFPLLRATPYDDIELISGPEIDLHCSCVIDANPEKGYVPAYCFEMTLHNQWHSFGRIDLRLGYNENIYYGGNIGYGIQEAYRGHGYAGRACRMLEPLIRRHGMRRVIITCRPDNLPSRKTCENLGAQLVRYLPLPEHSELYGQGDREECLFHWVLP